MTSHYVYLLTDPRDDKIFYIGQGSKTRAAEHVKEAQRWDKLGQLPLPPLGGKSPAERREKRLKILEILKDAGRPPIVEFLRTNLTKTQANLLETAAIELIGLSNLSNQVHGPAGAQRTRASLFEKISAATKKKLSRPAVVVPSAGVRGDFDALGGMVEAEPGVALENAETLWTIKEKNRAILNTHGASGEPILLVGVQSGPILPLARGLVIGVWEILRCEYDGPKLNTRWQGKGRDKVAVGTFETDGYRFVVKEESSRELDAIRDDLIWNWFVDADGANVKIQPGVVFANGKSVGLK